MAQNFMQSRRDQGFLLPPDVRDWLPADHLAWFVIDAVAQMDLAAIYGAYRTDGHGAAAYEPSMMVALLLYAYATRQRSSRAIECHCRQDVAYRVITGNVVPDHATIARFVVRHEAALAELFGEVLKLCDRGGLVKAGVIAIDGTRLAGNASKDRNRGFERIAKEILAEARATDEAEEEQHGEARGDELPEPLRTPEGRRTFFREATQRLRMQTGDSQSGEREEAGDAEVSSGSTDTTAQGDTSPENALQDGGAPDSEPREDTPRDGGGPEEALEGSEPPAGEPQHSGALGPEPEYVFDTERIVAREQGREGWPREARRQLEDYRWQRPQAVPRSRGERLVIAAERLEEELNAERRAMKPMSTTRRMGAGATGGGSAGHPTPMCRPRCPRGR